MKPALHKLLRLAGGIAMLTLATADAHAELKVLIVAGLGGEARYQQQFDSEAQAIQAASGTLTSGEHIHVLSGAGATRANIAAVMRQFAASLNQDDRLAVYLIGHGSYDGHEYKFNLPGPDLGGAELARLLDAVKSESQLLVATGSSSGALQEILGKDSRIVITATRSGSERNATQFGRLLAEVLTDTSADTDKNGRITAQEVFALATRKVNDYFIAESRLATEHAQMVGVRAEVFTIAQLAGATAPAADAASAELLMQRAALNDQVEELRLRKHSLDEDEYFEQLESLLLPLAELDELLHHGQPAAAP